jgi:hypothetical protein
VSRQLADRAWTGRQALEDRPPGGIAQRPEGFNGGRTVSHSLP